MRKIYQICFAIVLSALISPAFAATAPKVQTRASVDINGDGKPETVSIAIGKHDDYVLRVGKTAVQGYREGVQGFIVVDIDSSDKRKEIAVYAVGPSDTQSYLIYSYDRAGLHEIGSIAWAKFPGNGSVLGSDWTGSWLQLDKYVLDKSSGKLVVVPQELHWVGLKVTVTKSFPIYETRKAKTVVANLRVGSKIEVVATDLDSLRQHGGGSSWMLIKSESGLLGWVLLGTVQPSTDMPVAN